MIAFIEKCDDLFSEQMESYFNINVTVNVQLISKDAELIILPMTL